MLNRFIFWFARRFKPREGWPLFVLTAMILISAVRSVWNAEWVPEDNIVWVSLGVSFVVTYALIWHSYFGAAIRSIILLGYLLVFNSLFLMGYRPLLLFYAGRDAYQNELERALALFFARLRGWFSAVNSGAQSDETLIFAFALALFVGLMVAFFIHTSYRKQQPFIAVSVLLLLTGLNDVYSGESELLLLFMVVLGIVYLTLWQQRFREMVWDVEEIDYSAEMSGTTAVIAVLVTASLLFMGVVLPSLPYSSVARRFQQSAVVQAFERSFDRYFSGVNTNPAIVGERGGGEFGAGGIPTALSGVLPRSYLLGSPPDLTQTPVFSAEISTSRPLVGPQHWRSGSYDIYTGFGWRQSAPAETLFLANDLPIPMLIGVFNEENRLVVELEQRVTWLAPERYFNLLTVGRPTMFDQPVSAFMRAGDDLSHVSRVAGDYRPSYQATSWVVQRSRPTLSQVSFEQMRSSDPELYEHYTALPDTIPTRVKALAEQVTAGATSPYEQALLIEQYLRQYSYNLDIPPVPNGFDPVDYFLFELQEGYCDLYASSMVVMARSVGLPARLGVGYLNGGPDENGQILITQDRGHSWAEVYFPGGGWVEFEPTATFPVSPSAAPDALAESEILLEGELTEIPAGPTRLFGRKVPQWLMVAIATLFGLIGLAVLQAYRWHRQPKNMGELFLWLQDAAGRLGYRLEESETATEFGQGFLSFLQTDTMYLNNRVNLGSFESVVPALVRVYEVDQYSRAGVKKDELEQATEEWQAIRRPLLWLWLWQRWQKSLVRVAGKKQLDEVEIS